MIAYRVKQSALEALIEAESNGWLTKAAKRTKVFRERNCYDESSSIWSAVKAVYMRLQGDCKCAYCERKLESIDFGKIEQDVEHFRPKGRISAWALPKSLQDQGIRLTPVPNDEHGYFLLPYHPMNYLAACKPCNSMLKKDYFPIAGEYDLKGDDPAKLHIKEKPFLICPVGDFDDAPEDLIRFFGVSPQAVAQSGFNRERAFVTIEFFKLDDATERKNLLRERANIIVALYPQLEKVADDASGIEKNNAQQFVDDCTSLKSPHTNCARSLKDLFLKNRAEAKAVCDRAFQLINSMS
ncbi:MAG: hypothetical protein WBP54_06160 [Pelodictyon phaeoclathratiforme]